QVEAVDDLAETGEAAPGLHVLQAGRAERGEVAEDQVVEPRFRVDIGAEPRLDGGQPGLAAAAPDSFGWNVNQRKQVAGGAGHGLGVEVWPVLAEQDPELGE